MIWRPDTCGCVLEYGLGGNTAASFVRAVNTCPAHAGEPDLHAAILADNQKKNRVLAAIIERAPALAGTTWAYEGRRLIITLPEGQTLPPLVAATVAASYPGVEIR